MAGGDRHRKDRGGPVEVRTPARTRIYEFHGHVGPYVVLGYRLGEIARRILESPGYFDLSARVESPLAPPPSCLLDGIQLGSGCTLGKGNIEVAEGPIGRAVFRTKAGREVRIALRGDLADRIRRWIEAMGVEETGRKVLGMPEEELFVIEGP